MITLNKVLIVGNLTHEPELRFTPTGTKIANLRIAINRRFKDKEETCFITVVAWNKLAEVCVNYLKKGHAILVEGRLTQRNWQAEDKTNRSVVEINAESIEFLTKNEKSSHETANKESENEKQTENSISVDD